jgi:hypothetical protein
MAVRLTGALVLQLDGDEGALDRLSRECAPTGAPPIGPVPPIHMWTGYLGTLARLAWDFQTSLQPLTCWDPARTTRALEWAADTEACWYAYLSEASSPVSASDASRHQILSREDVVGMECDRSRHRAEQGSIPISARRPVPTGC